MVEMTRLPPSSSSSRPLASRSRRLTAPSPTTTRAPPRRRRYCRRRRRPRPGDVCGDAGDRVVPVPGVPSLPGSLQGRGDPARHDGLHLLHGILLGRRIRRGRVARRRRQARRRLLRRPPLRPPLLHRRLRGSSN